MKVALTAKLKLSHTPEEREALRAVSLAYREGLNLASERAFEMDKTSNAKKIHHSVYAELRERLKLPSQLACSVSRYVGATYKTLS